MKFATRYDQVRNQPNITYAILILDPGMFNTLGKVLPQGGRSSGLADDDVTSEEGKISGADLPLRTGELTDKQGIKRRSLERRRQREAQKKRRADNKVGFFHGAASCPDFDPALMRSRAAAAQPGGGPLWRG